MAAVSMAGSSAKYASRRISVRTEGQRVNANSVALVTVRMGENAVTARSAVGPASVSTGASVNPAKSAVEAASAGTGNSETRAKRVVAAVSARTASTGVSVSAAKVLESANTTDGAQAARIVVVDPCASTTVGDIDAPNARRSARNERGCRLMRRCQAQKRESHQHLAYVISLQNRQTNKGQNPPGSS